MRYLIFLLLTGCSGLPSKQTTSIQGAVVNFPNIVASGAMSAVGFSGVNNQLILDASRREFKKNVQKVKQSDIGKLNPVTFEWNDKSTTPNVEDMGFIAEEVQRVNPLFTKNRADGTPQTLNDRAILAALVKEVQELRAEVDKLKK